MSDARCPISRFRNAQIMTLLGKSACFPNPPPHITALACDARITEVGVMDVSRAPANTTRMAGAAFRWMPTAQEAFAIMLDAVNAAHASIRLETYIVKPGEIADRFRDALIQAA